MTREILSGAQAPGFIRHRVKPSTERTGSVCALHFAEPSRHDLVTQCIHPVITMQSARHDPVHS